MDETSHKHIWMNVDVSNEKKGMDDYRRNQ